MSTTPRDPETIEEWQQAVDAADFMLALHAARCYGLVTGGPEVNVDRCQRILAAGAQYGVVPTADNIHRMIREYMR